MPKKRSVKAKVEFHSNTRCLGAFTTSKKRHPPGSPQIARGLSCESCGELQINPDLSELKFDQVRNRFCMSSFSSNVVAYHHRSLG
jgi:hypothetical protein